MFDKRPFLWIRDEEIVSFIIVNCNNKGDSCIIIHRDYMCYVICGREEIRTPKGLSPAQLATETASP